MLRAGLIGRDERQANLVILCAGKRDLCLLSFFLDTLHRVGLAGEVDAAVTLELCCHPVDDRVVPVVTAEVRVAVGGLHLKYLVADFENGNVKGAAAQIINGYLLLFFLVETIRQRGRRGFVDNSQHFQPGNLAGVLGGLPLGVVEVSRHGDDRLCDRFPKAHLRIRLQLSKQHGSNFLRTVHLLLAIHFHLDGRVAIAAGDHFIRHALGLLLYLCEFSANEPLGRKHRVRRVCHRLSLGRVANQPLTILAKRNYRGRGALALGIFQHRRLPAFHHTHAGIRGAQIDA